MKAKLNAYLDNHKIDNSAIYSEVFGNRNLDTFGERQSNLRLIKIARSLVSNDFETLDAVFNHGPLHDGDIPSANSRNKMYDLGVISRVIVKGEYGFNICTYKGAFVYRCCKAIINTDDRKEK